MPMPVLLRLVPSGLPPIGKGIPLNENAMILPSFYLGYSLESVYHIESAYLGPTLKAWLTIEKQAIIEQ